MTRLVAMGHAVVLSVVQQGMTKAQEAGMCDPSGERIRTVGTLEKAGLRRASFAASTYELTPMHRPIKIIFEAVILPNLSPPALQKLARVLLRNSTT